MTIDRLRFYEAAGSRWRRPVADMLLRLRDHLSAAEALRGSAHRSLAPGAAAVAAIVALRVAATASLAHDEFVGKWDALGTYPRLVDPVRRERLARLLEAARQVETDQRLGDGLRVELSKAAGGSWSTGPTRLMDPAALELYADVLWVSDDLNSVSNLVEDVAGDARELEARGLARALEGAEAYLCDVALGLCGRPPTSLLDASAQGELLQRLQSWTRGRSAVRTMINAAVAIDRGSWGGVTAGSA